LSTSGKEGAADALDEAVRVARENGVDSTLVFVLPFLAEMLPIEEAERAHAMADEALSVATRSGDVMGLAAATWFKGSLAARNEQWEVALSACVDALGLQRQIGDVVTASGPMYMIAVALTQLGAAESPALLIGKADAMGTGERFGPKSLLPFVAGAEAMLREQLGSARFAELAARGAALSFTDAVDYARAEADAVLRSALGA
jgi:hypothetical protein